jgi:hypothetical protein
MTVNRPAATMILPTAPDGNPTAREASAVAGPTGDRGRRGDR